MKSNMIKILAMRAKNRMMNKANNATYSQAHIKIINDKDEEFLERVRAVLASEKKSLNPMKHLMDDRSLMKLDANGRERYLLEITEKYLKAKAVIEREKLAS